MSTSKNTGGGIELTVILFVVFLILKLCNVIDWSWWWITAPLWGAFALLAVFIIIGGIFFGISYLIHRIKNKK